MKRFAYRIIVIFVVFAIMVLIIGSNFSLAYIEKKDKDKQNNEKKNYVKAGLGAMGSNIVVWTFDRYIVNEDWAKISINSIVQNFKIGYMWDNNSFGCNQMEHPLHGTLYYSAGRINNLNFWESSILAFSGSFVWEFMLETNRPSTNDHIFTWGAGSFLGESLFRIANDLIIDNSASGLERVFRETLAFIVNPVVGFDRLITGKSSRKEGSSGKHYYDLSMPVGIYDQGLIFGIDIEYKDAMIKKRLSPYDYFTLDFRTEINSSLMVERLLNMGLLFGKRTNKALSENGNLFGLFANFDYMNNTLSDKISTIGIGPGLVANTDLGSNYSLDFSIFALGIFGGTTSSFALKYGKNFFTDHGEKHRFKRGGDSYHLGPGLFGKLTLELEKKDVVSARVRFFQYWISSIFIETDEWLSILSCDFKLNLTKWVQLNSGIDYYWRNAFYKNLTLHKKGSVFRNSLVFKF